jgi:hypothetical protein
MCSASNRSPSRLPHSETSHADSRSALPRGFQCRERRVMARQILVADNRQLSFTNTAILGELCASGRSPRCKTGCRSGVGAIGTTSSPNELSRASPLRQLKLCFPQLFPLLSTQRIFVRHACKCREAAFYEVIQCAHGLPQAISHRDK